MLHFRTSILVPTPSSPNSPPAKIWCVFNTTWSLPRGKSPLLVQVSACSLESQGLPWLSSRPLEMLVGPALVAVLGDVGWA